MLAKHIPEDFTGAILVRRGDEALLSQGYGFADRPNEVPNAADTKFGTASAGKAFVAAGIMRLISEGKLALETTIGETLTFDLKQIDPAITVRQLLNHTSGIPDYFDEEVMEEYAELFIDLPNYRIRTSMDLVPLFIDKPMMYPRGEKFQYNNTGYVVLGLIIEQITGMPFDAYLRENIFMPFGMADTGYYEMDRLPAKCANAYILDKATNEYYTNIYSVDVKGTGAGGAFTTVLDVERFWRGLASGTVLPREVYQAMTTAQVDSGEYGYGFWLREEGERRIPFFQGSDPGVSFVSSFDEEKDTIAALVSNMEDNVWAIHRAFRAEL